MEGERGRGREGMKRGRGKERNLWDGFDQKIFQQNLIVFVVRDVHTLVHVPTMRM